MTEIYMPRLSDTMEEGVISSWRKQVGDKVSRGDVLVEIETDKAVMEYEAYDEGFLVKQAASEGDTVPIGAVIGMLGETPDAAPAEAGAAPTAPAEAAEPSAPEPAAEPEDSGPEPSATSQEAAAEPRTRTSPLARRLAREYGLDIDQIQGSGPKGRVVRADIEAAAQAARPVQPQPAAEPVLAAAAPTPQEFDDGRASEELTVTQMRKVIARRMAESKQQVPHFYLRRTVDAEELKEFRAQVNAQLADTGVKISFNDLIVKAAATTLRAHPEVNRSWVDGRYLQHHRINVGVAVAVDEGLVVPVLRDTDKAALSDIATTTRELAGKAREGKLTPQEMSGGTFSVSNLGMFGIDSFSAVINPPEPAILAVGAMRQEPVVRDGEIVARNTIALELSVDHRAVDGAVGAAFLRDLAEVLEHPMRILL